MSIRPSFPRLAVACAWLLLTSGAQATERTRYGRPRRSHGSPALDWPARIVMFPLWAVTELVLRRPIGAGVRALESSDAVQKAQDGSSDGPWKQLSILPAARIDVGLKPIVGLNASWHLNKNRLAMQLGTWGPKYLLAQLTDSYDARPRQRITAAASFGRRQDTPFYGLGSHSERRDRARFESITTRVQVGYEHDFWRSSRLSVAVGGRGQWYGDGACCDDPSVRQAVSIGQLAAPGLDQDYGASFQRMQFTLDSKPEQPKRGFGFRISAYEEATFAFAGTTQPGAPRRSWVQYGASLATRVDLTGTRRFLELAVHASFADPLQGQLPFTDQVALGGDDLMPGYLRGRLVDRSALVGTLRYTWPFWTYLDGTLHAAVGNVFGHQLHDVDVRSLRYSAGVGIRTKGNPASRFEALFAIGSTPFDEGGRIDSFRLLIGTQHGL